MGPGSQKVKICHPGPGSQNVKIVKGHCKQKRLVCSKKCRSFLSLLGIIRCPLWIVLVLKTIIKEKIQDKFDA